MSPWNRGRVEINGLIAAGDLERRHGADVGAAALMRRATQQLDSARAVVDVDPVTAFVVAYDAARHAGTALLAEQNLRVTARGGHVAVERALTAQFAAVFTSYRNLRRRRNELDYPSSDHDFADTDEASNAITTAAGLVADAQKILDQGILSVY